MATILRQRRGQLSLLLAVGIAGVAVGFGLLYGAYRVGKKEGAAQTPKITISNDVIVNQMRQVSQLVATKAYLTDIIEYNDTRNVLLGILKGRKKILVVARGHLNLGVDLSRVSPAIDSTKRTVSVDVPHATMLDPVLDTTLRYYDVKKSVFNRFTEQDAANIQCSVDSAFRVAGRDMRVLQRADSDVKQALTSLLQGYGYTAIINFLPTPAATAGGASGQPADTASPRPAARDTPPARCEFGTAPP